MGCITFFGTFLGCITFFGLYYIFWYLFVHNLRPVSYSSVQLKLSFGLTVAVLMSSCKVNEQSAWINKSNLSILWPQGGQSLKV